MAPLFHPGGDHETMHKAFQCCLVDTGWLRIAKRALDLVKIACELLPKAA